jgi:hypothetical protein
MNRRRFKHRLDTLGSDLSAWPQSEQLAARRMLERDPKAARLFIQARALDNIVARGLRSSANSAEDEAAAARVLMQLSVDLPPQERPPHLLHRRGIPLRRGSGIWVVWPRAVALATAAALGIALGLAVSDRPALEGRQLLSAADEADADLSSALFETDQTSAP